MNKDLGPKGKARMTAGRLQIAISLFTRARPNRKRGKDEGGAAVPVIPNHPRTGEGGAAAALAFDD